MKKQTKLLIIYGVILLLAAIYFLASNKPPKIDQSKISTSHLIDYSYEYNYRQTFNDCGPFNVAAVVRTLKKEEVSSADFAENMKWRLPNKYTLPWGLEKQLEENDISIEAPNVKPFSNEEKLAFLQERLSQGRPIIILGERKNYEHYITIFGFDNVKNEFYVYDSLFDKGEEDFTIDTNGSLPGNRTFSSEELITFWQGGGMYGFYNWYVIVASEE